MRGLGFDPHLRLCVSFKKKKFKKWLIFWCSYIDIRMAVEYDLEVVSALMLIYVLKIKFDYNDQ